ncbi:PrsW family intramembrane metalloprotease, partial [Streptomyces europaeiscabiei]|nr:PrsW family intramembrane metalloprotease [Streptomyces europaeiscabiei]
TKLAFLGHWGLRGRAGDGFALRERELLFELWRRRELARPAMGYAGREAGPKHGYGYGYGYGYEYEYGGYGYGYGYGYGSAYPQPVAYGMAPYPSYNPYQC